MSIKYTIMAGEHQTSATKQGRRATSLKRMDEGVKRARSAVEGRASTADHCPPFTCKFIFSGTAFNSGDTNIYFIQ